MSEDEVRKAFERFDIDSDGQINVSELVNLMKLLGHRISEEEGQELLKKVDANKDEVIDEKEFQAYMKIKEDDDEIRTAFKNFDKDGNGVIQAAELMHVLTEFGQQLNDEEVDEMMRVADADGDGKINFKEFTDFMKKLRTCPTRKLSQTVVNPGVSDLWSAVNHIALVVSDIGRSCAFYSGKLGMQQIMRPDFDRHGAWFTMGNIDLHLIKGRPAVHKDDDLIVSHIALNVGGESDMQRMMERLESLKVPFRENISVPNPDSDIGRVKQAFVRDPDGYYLEFCSCEGLEQYLVQKMTENKALWDIYRINVALSMKQLVTDWAGKAKSGTVLDQEKLNNLLARQKIYGDITQSASPLQLEELLVVYDNDVPAVIAALKDITKKVGGRTYLPPAFYERDQSFIQPPAFRITEKSLY